MNFRNTRKPSSTAILNFTKHLTGILSKTVPCYLIWTKARTFITSPISSPFISPFISPLLTPIWNIFVRIITDISDFFSPNLCKSEVWHKQCKDRMTLKCISKKKIGRFRWIKTIQFFSLRYISFHLLNCKEIIGKVQNITPFEHFDVILGVLWSQVSYPNWFL